MENEREIISSRLQPASFCTKRGSFNRDMLETALVVHIDFPSFVLSRQTSAHRLFRHV
jgi:hypothetical protein